MGLLLQSLSMLFFLLLLLFGMMPSIPSAQNLGNSSAAHALDAILQDYAYRAFVRPRTGVPYDGTVPSNLTGIKISAMRLVRGSLKARGVSRYKEFEIPTGVIETPYVKRLVLVYQNLGNLSEIYYPLSNFTYLAPVLGLLAYNASNLSATNLPELSIVASQDPITVDFSSIGQAPSGSTPKCVWFSLQGSVNFSNMTSGSRCSTTQQGHFSVVVESVGGKGKSRKVWIILGSVVGGIVLLILLAILGVWMEKQWHKSYISRMQEVAGAGEPLEMRTVRGIRYSTAGPMRTAPALETEYVP
ncbi:hypothetical protein SAY87_014745 [Trapa incisa]|uniref:Uncharacterized protein n=2 Tax=Trapa TaxID=22665 RepID=A0AAN7RGZ8_TRANT|nr:hypothetical protein SAY87_014745 [Trapa incisa]KAK4802595.1 hypothetical protein SAY86_000798 [Trapa natans]